MPDNAAIGCASCDQAAIAQWRRRSADDAGHTDAVYACAVHAITLDLAAHIHQPTCPAPDPAHLPACGCDPEPLPPPEPLAPAPITLPTGWTVPPQT
jgi:hypothetical protein